jgi:hypothetical protein
VSSAGDASGFMHVESDKASRPLARFAGVHAHAHTDLFTTGPLV